MSAADPARSAPDCLRCRAYFVTYEPTLPHGCRTYAFKSVRLPRDEVRLSSGAECAAFEARVAARRPEGRNDGSRTA